MNATPPTGPLVTPPKPPIPSTNLLPAIIIVAMVAALCLALAVMLPSPRRPASPPPANVPVQPLPAKPAAPFPPLPITEYEDATKATLPSPTVDSSPTSSLPSIPAPQYPSTPLYQRNAQPAPAVPPGNATLAIVIDDMGVDEPLTRQAMEQLPSTVTFAFLPYGRNSRQLAATAHSNGHEILIHMPMEALPRPNGSPTPLAGPRALLVEDDATTRETNLASNLAALESVAVGVNNHMGSRFTQWEEGMRNVLATLDEEGLLFLDSVTTAHTATTDAAKSLPKLSIPLLRRDVFLDDGPTPEEVEHELARAIAMAKKNGHAIAIGHPHPATLAVLAERLPALEQVSLTLVPLTYMINK